MLIEICICSLFITNVSVLLVHLYKEGIIRFRSSRNYRLTRDSSESPESCIVAPFMRRRGGGPVGDRLIASEKLRGANIRVKVINLYTEDAFCIPMNCNLKFNNTEMDDHVMCVKPLHQEDINEYYLPEIITLKANQYASQWDNIPEYTLGTLKIETVGTSKTAPPKVFDGFLNYSIELDFDEKTNAFITA